MLFLYRYSIKNETVQSLAKPLDRLNWTNGLKGLGWILAFLILTWPSMRLLKYSIQDAYEFQLTDDEAYHVELVEHLAQTGEYKGWSSAPFAPALTTGPTVILPAALIQKLTGLPSVRSGRLWVLIVSCVSLSLLLFKAAAGLPLLLGVFTILVQTHSETQYFLYGVLGDGVVWAFALASFLAIQRSWFGWGSAFAILAVFSKPYALTLPIALTLYLLLQAPKLRSVWVRWLIGNSIPLVLAGLGLTSVLGFSGAFQFVIDYPSVMKATNGGEIAFTQVSNLLGQIVGRLQAIPDLLGWSGVWVLLVGQTGWIKMRKLTFPLLFGAIHLVWWLTSAPSPQLRYLFPSILALILGFQAFSLTQSLTVRKFAYGLAGILLIAQIVNAAKFIVRTSETPDSCRLCRQIDVQNWIYEQHHSNGVKPDVWLSTSEGYSCDLALRLRVPSQCKSISEVNEVDKNYWVLVGHGNQKSIPSNWKCTGAVFKDTTSSNVLGCLDFRSSH